MQSENDLNRVMELLKRYGYQSQSYNILRSDKSYFFSPSGIDGVIAYVVYVRVALAAGDPVCAQSDLPTFVAEFKLFCRAHGWRCCFQAITDRCKTDLENMGFDIIKIGEEPIFELAKLSWEGGKYGDLRKDINSARRHGLTVVEYCPLAGRRHDWEKQMEELSAIWKEFKGSGEFSFLIGEPSLDAPGERKYFLALINNQVEAFIVCAPIFARNGIYFDLMRRRQKPLRGTSQLLITESFRLLKEQGYAMATLGAAPLASEHVDDPTQNHIIEMALKFAFDRLGYFHRFKPTYRFKEQFAPTSWEGHYLAFGSHRFNPIILYALLKAYDPSGVTGKLLRQIQHAWRGIRTLNPVPGSLRHRLPGR